MICPEAMCHNAEYAGRQPRADGALAAFRLHAS